MPKQDVRKVMDVAESLRLFQGLLNASWPTVREYEERYFDPNFNDVRINWLQANWEMTVEQSVLQGSFFLEVYGEGADFGGKSSRVSYPDALPTHHILCSPREDSILLTGNLNTAFENPDSGLKSTISKPLVFDCFATMTESGWFEETSPFDCVIANHGDSQVLFKFEDALYSLEKIEH